MSFPFIPMLLGAAGGALFNKKDPLTGALMGGGLGAAGGLLAPGGGFGGAAGQAPPGRPLPGLRFCSFSCLIQPLRGRSALLKRLAVA